MSPRCVIHFVFSLTIWSCRGHLCAPLCISFIIARLFYLVFIFRRLPSFHPVIMSSLIMTTYRSYLHYCVRINYTHTHTQHVYGGVCVCRECLRRNFARDGSFDCLPIPLLICSLSGLAQLTCTTSAIGISRGLTGIGRIKQLSFPICIHFTGKNYSVLVFHMHFCLFEFTG